MRRRFGFSPYAIFASRLMRLACTAVLPAAAGCWWALQPDSPRSASPASPAPAVAGDFVRGRIIIKPDRYPTVPHWVNDMANWSRIEDLRAVLDQLPPGMDRTLALCSIAYQWQSRDCLATQRWIEKLPTEEDRATATRQFINVWAENDPFPASAWLADQPDGPVKASSAVTLARSIGSFDPGAALEWAIVGRSGTRGEQTLEWQARWMGRWDPDGCLRILSRATTLPQNLKNHLRRIAIAEWNIRQAELGNWDQIHGKDHGAALLQGKP